MCTVPGVTKILVMRIISEMGANYHQRYYSPSASAKGIGVVPSNKVSSGKLIERRASHGNHRVKFHLISAAKVVAIHGKGPLQTWYKVYRGRTKYMKAVSALARRMVESLWWVMVRDEPYRYWQGELPRVVGEVAQFGSLIVNPKTGEVLDEIEPSVTTTYD